jgi:endoglucanase
MNKFTVGVAALLLPALPVAACSFDQAPQVRAESCNQRLARSINFGNMLDHPREGMAGPALRDEFIELSAKAGFTAIRLPVRWDAQAGYQAPYAISPEFFERIDGVVKKAQAAGLAIILDMHHYAGMMSEPREERPRFLALWKQVAEHYRDAPATVLFEVLNEPNKALDEREWNQALAAVLPVIRASNPNRTLIVGGAQWNSRKTLWQLALPEDDRNLIATFHYYEPMEVTHQGAEWVAGAGAWTGTRWRGSDSELRTLRQAFDDVVEWGRRQKRPIFLGEFGAYSRADEGSRIAWTRAVRAEAEARGFAWAYWELAAGFGVLDPHSLKWRQPLLSTLLPDKATR